MAGACTYTSTLPMDRFDFLQNYNFMTLLFISSCVVFDLLIVGNEFSHDVICCRSSYLDYQKDVKLTWSWMPLYRFEMPKWELWNETRCPLNAQFYANWLYGILNLSNATKGEDIMS